MQNQFNSAGQAGSRRRFLRNQLALWSVSAIAGNAMLPTVLCAAPQDINGADEVLVRLKSVLEVRGEVRLKSNSTANDKLRRADLESKATLQYEERFRKLTAASEPGVSVISCQVATGQNTVEKHATDLTLREQSKVILRWTDPGQSATSTAGVDQPLTETERQLSESPIVSMYLENIVPPKKVAIGEKHPLSKIQSAQLLNLDAVNGGELTVVVIDQDDKEQQLEISGKISAAVQSVPTAIELTGKARVNRESGLVSYLAVSIQEEREVGYAEPGFNVTARLRLIREQIDKSEQLKPLAAYTAVLDKNRRNLLQAFESTDGGYSFLANQNWVLYKDNGIDSILRLVKTNRSLAQCNIVNLADMEPGRQLTIDGFKSEIKRTLGSSFGSYLEESERLTDTKLRMMRVIVGGKIEGVDVQWINLLISNDEGRHVSVVYTLNAANVEAFDAADIQLADSFTFTRRLKSAEEIAEIESATESR